MHVHVSFLSNRPEAVQSFQGINCQTDEYGKNRQRRSDEFAAGNATVKFNQAASTLAGSRFRDVSKSAPTSRPSVSQCRACADSTASVIGARLGRLLRDAIASATVRARVAPESVESDAN